MKYIWYIAALLIVNSSFSQKVDNISVQVEGGKVYIQYDLLEESKANSAFIILYSSHNYKDSLKMVLGDVNKIIYAGKGKSIIWDASKEIQHFDGLIRIKVMSRIADLNVNGTKFKKGRMMMITWTGGGPITEKYRVELVSSKNKATEIDVIQNSRSYQFEVPKHVRKGKGYRIRLTNTVTPQESGFSGPFNIIPKIAVGYKVVAPVAGAAVVIGSILLFSKDERIPDPPDTP